MIISPSLETLKKLVRHQIYHLFLLESVEDEAIERLLPEALYRTEKCFTHSQNKYYKKDGEVFFSIYHSGQYCIFLYFLSRQAYLAGTNLKALADKIYYLNKSLNGLDLYYEAEMPSVFHLDHPVGSVMGRATYGENFTFSQLCTVGNNKGIFPVIGSNVTMLSGAKVVGQCIIGNNVVISANTYIKDTHIPSDSLVFGSYPNLVIKKNRVRKL